MPRTQKTPSQVGAPNTGMSNRVDLMAEGAHGTQPIRVPTGQPYGEATALSNAQHQAPLPQTVAPPSDPRAALQSAKAFAMPNLDLGGATARPNEPVTSGVAAGPGPGPTQRFNGAAMLRVLANATNDPFMRDLADQAERQGV